MLAHRQALKILAENASERVEERYGGYRADAVRKLKAIIDAQAQFESDARRQQEVLAELAALAALVATKRGST